MPEDSQKWHRRNSDDVVQAVNLLVDRGLLGPSDQERATAGRRVEDHSRRGLLPPGRPTSDELAASEAELMKVDRRGPGGTTRAAYILLARGFAVDLIDRAP